MAEESQGAGEDGRELFWDLSGRVLAACIEVHRCCGPGLLESVYEECLAYELAERRIACSRQVTVPLRYKRLTFEHAYRADLIVERSIIVEVKAVGSVIPVHIAQLLTYLNLAELDVGLLVNFNAPYLRDGVRRLRRRQRRSGGLTSALTRVPWPETI